MPAWSIGGRLDRCDWLAFPGHMLRDAVRDVEPSAANAPRGPLRAMSTPISAALYAAQRQLCVHPCRVFRAVTGATMSEYRTQLGVRAALEPVPAGVDLTGTALSLGFDTHSHFTYAFRRTFGVPPSTLRAGALLPHGRRRA